MIVGVVTTADSEALTYLENVKEVLEIEDSKYDELLTRQIARSSARVQTYLGRPLALQIYDAILPSYGGINLRLPRYPIRSVMGLFDGSDTGTATEYIEGTDFRVDREAGLIEMEQGFPWTFQERQDVTDFPEARAEYRRWYVKWSAGYFLPSQTLTTADGSTATGGELPPDIEQACLEDIRIWYLGRKREPGVSNMKVGALSVTYRESENRGLPDSVLALLEPYRSLV